jgi:hypothetical protein
MCVVVADDEVERGQVSLPDTQEELEQMVAVKLRKKEAHSSAAAADAVIFFVGSGPAIKARSEVEAFLAAAAAAMAAAAVRSTCAGRQRQFGGWAGAAPLSPPPPSSSTCGSGSLAKVAEG